MKTNTTLEVLESRIAPAFMGTVNLSSLAHVDGHTANDQAGFSVAEAGDVNGDGLGDFIIGAPGADSGVGRAYVVFGKNGGQPLTTDLDSIGTGTGFQISGQFSNGLLGRSVAAAGDVNGDGYDDVVVGAPLANINANNACGIAYVVFGGANPADVKASNLDGLNGFAVFGNEVGDLCGISVSGAGDVNGDGFADVIVGASGFDVPKQGGTFLNDAGGAVVMYGHAGAFLAFSNFIKIGDGSNLSGVRITGEAAGDAAGIAVGGAGDFNGDGIDDLVIGANGAGVGGTAYVMHGSKTLAIKGSLVNADLKIKGIASGDSFGSAVAGIGDFNRDGFADIVVGAAGSNATGNNSGEADVIFGGKNVVGTMSAANANIRLQGAGDNVLAGTSVHAAGDFNGDGYADLIVGATHANVGPGEAYVVFGKAAAFTAPVNLSGLDGAAGFKIVGNTAGNDEAYAVSTAGDLNHDGYADLLVSTPGQTVNGKMEAGKTSIVYGSNGGNKVNLSADGRTATYTDVDGDLVTIKVNKGQFEQNDFQLSGQNALGGSALQLLDLTGHTDLNLANLTITAKAQMIGGVLHGDGHANVGDLNAPSISFGTVKICGDLGRITAGGGGLVAPAVKTLSVYSLGAAREVTQSLVAQNDFSFVTGGIGVLNVTTNVEGVNFLAGKIGVAKIGGDVRDSSFFVVGDSAPKNAAAAVAVKSFNVRGDFDHSAIRGGAFFPGNADVQLGRITIGGNFIASTLTAGVTQGSDGLFATADDSVYSGGSAAIVSRIASVVIKGQAIGTNEAGGHFAIEAEQIGSVKVGTTRVALEKTVKDQFLQLGGTGDLFVHEV